MSATRLVFAALCLLAACGAPQDEKAPAGEAAEPALPMQTVSLRYAASIPNVVELGTASYEVSYSARAYEARGELNTSERAPLFDATTISGNASGTLAGRNAAWTNYTLSHAFAGKSRTVRMRHADNAVTVEVDRRWVDMGQPPATPAQRAASYDPLSAIFVLGRRIGAARECNGSVPVFDGRQHYRIAVVPKGEGPFDGGGFNGPALNCALYYEPIAGYNLTPEERAAIPIGDAWFALPTEGIYAPLLRLTVPTPLGGAVLDLRGIEGEL